MKLKKDPTKIFWSSDLHLNHINLCRATSEWPDSEKCRDFTSIPHMNQTILEGINDTVDEESTLFLLGDLLFGMNKDYVDLLSKIRCRDVRVIHGNHDNVNKLKLIGESYYGAEFKITINGQYIHAYHHPSLSWENMSQGSIHLFGHVHSSIEQANGPVADYMNERRCLDVGVDNAHHLLGQYIPFRFDWIIDRLSNHISNVRNF